MDVDKLKLEYPMISDMMECREIMWLNEKSGGEMVIPFGLKDIEDAEARLARFAPYIMKAFPETEITGGNIPPLANSSAKRLKRMNEKHNTIPTPM